MDTIIFIILVIAAGVSLHPDSNTPPQVVAVVCACTLSYLAFGAG